MADITAVFRAFFRDQGMPLALQPCTSVQLALVSVLSQEWQPSRMEAQSQMLEPRQKDDIRQRRVSCEWLCVWMHFGSIFALCVLWNMHALEWYMLALSGVCSHITHVSNIRYGYRQCKCLLCISHAHWTRTHAHTHTHAHKHTHTYMYVCLYIHTHTHTHT